MQKLTVDDLAQQASDKKKKDQQKYDKYQEMDNLVTSTDMVQSAIIETTRAMLQYLEETTHETKVTNFPEQPDSIKTPDVAHVVAAVEHLGDLTREKEVDFEPVVQTLRDLGLMIDELPKAFPEIPKPLKSIEVNNLDDVVKVVKALNKDIKKLKLDPKIDVKASDVKIDLKPIEKRLEKLSKQLKEQKPIELPEYPETDLGPLKQAIDDVNNSINSLTFPVPNMKPVFTDSDGVAVRPTVSSQGRVSISGQLVTEDYDYIAATYPTSSTEKYTYKLGGSGGTTVATVDVAYTDATKATLSTVTRS